MKKIIFFCLFANSLFGQVYNYDPIRHSSIEINPAYLASDKNNFTASYNHTGSYYMNRFFSDGIKLSKYNESRFTGLGLVINNSRVNDSIRYSYAGIGAAYRTILFNKIFTRIGFLFKVIDIKSPLGIFDYYSFEKGNESINKNRIVENVNFSVSFSSAKDKMYLSVGVLNKKFLMFDRGQDSFFPQYYFINIGDLGKLLDEKNWEISYSMYVKKYIYQKALKRSHHIIISYDGFKLSRRSGFKFGSRLGYVDGKYVQLTPSLSFYHRTQNKKNLIYQLLYDTGIKVNKNSSSYKSNSQINITYLF